MSNAVKTSETNHVLDNQDKTGIRAVTVALTKLVSSQSLLGHDIYAV